ncbi:MAG: TIGR03936 family radical SAM-associated protein [Dehalococcoidia bacterium]
MSEIEPPACVSSAKAQRLRIRFARGAEARNVGHLDIARVWERAFQEAGITVSYSEGRHPRPRITFASGLPGDATSEGELLDVILAELVSPAEVASRVQPHLPAGIDLREAFEVGMGLHSLPSLARWADYQVDLPAESAADVDERVARLLAANELPWEDTRGEKTRRYDLRALVQTIVVERAGEVTRLRMRLRCESAGVGRPEQVVLALGLPAPASVHRERLVLTEVSPARYAWRRRGRFVA